MSMTIKEHEMLYTGTAVPIRNFNDGAWRLAENVTATYSKPNYEVNQWLGSKIDYLHDWATVFDSGRYIVRAPHTKPTSDEIRKSDMDIDTLLSGA